MVAGSDHGSAAIGSAIDLEVAGSGPVGCCFPSSFFTMCSSLPGLSLFNPVNPFEVALSLYIGQYILYIHHCLLD